ncbi:hypothetical protein G6O69_26515 [Pseudenhygromyxa sp. WMMC2535]|uniref:hypothetical protein n=1 Tax=Pseudenhygromyxa sp. WMMC2535 TaxID=2712867 RepID=UPI0015532220|nr:hypothetical protein [Pseudenhygromyxa sp. WMMC2535]NVB41420.1 hypothetical protein [Pseudenhygromyxa sp. WMMC2535]
MLSPGAIVDPEDLRIPGEQPGTPVVVIDDLGELAHGQRFRARQGKSLLLLTVLTPEVVMQRELRDLLLHRLLQISEVAHPNLLPTYGWVPLPLGEEGFETLFVVRPDPGCPTLRQWLHEVWQAGHTLDPLNAVAIAVQVCQALAALHEHCAHGFVTVDNVFMYPTGGMPQALLSAAGEGVVLPFAPAFEPYAQAGYLPMAGPELFEPPHEPRVETDVLGAAGLVLEILTGQPLEAGMSLAHFNLPPRLERILEVASRPNPEDRPQDILMFSRRLQAAVGLGDDPVEPAAVLEPVHHGEHADPRYPAVRAKPWRPPPAPPPPWAEGGPTPGSGAWNVGAPTPGSGAWNLGAGGPTPGSGAWNLGASGPTPGSGAWNLGGRPPVPSHSSTSGSWNMGRTANQPATQAPPSAWRPTPPPASEPPSSAPFGRSSPVVGGADSKPAAPTPPPSTPRPEATTKLFGRGGPTPPAGLAPVPGSPPAPSSAPPSLAQPAPVKFADGATLDLAPGSPASFGGTSVSIMMPAPDGSVLAQIGQGPRNYTIVRRGKTHGPYDMAQLQRLIELGKLRSVDTLMDSSNGEKILAVDLPGMRPLFEAKARESESSPKPPTGSQLAITPSPSPSSRRGLWMVVGLLGAALLAVVAFLATQ